MRIFLHEGTGGRGEEGLFGRVAKNHSLQSETFSQGKEAEGIDTFRASMLKYIEKERNRKGDGSMKAKMMRAKLKDQFAAAFAVAPVFPFLMC